MEKREFLKKSGLLGLTAGIVPGKVFYPFNTRSPKDSHMRDSNDFAEARYVIETPKGLRCLICPNECTLKEGEISDCHNRKVINGKLFTMAYNHPCAIHIDPIEKKPLFHYMPGAKAFSFGTAGCNFSCLNCQNSEISQVSPEAIRSYKFSPAELVDAALNENCPTIAYTYTEPISYYEYMLDTAKIARQKGLKNLMISNGYINEKPLLELVPYLDAANIDLKAFDDTTYQRLTGGKLEPVLETLEILKDQGVWLEITNLIVPEWSDDLEMIERMCKWLAKKGFEDYPLHFSRFHPAYKLKHLRYTPFKSLLDAKNIALKHGLKYVYIGNVPDYDGENTQCPECHEILVKRKGFQILSNNINKGICYKCQNRIAGVWS